jgi:hypothetical protein
MISISTDRETRLSFTCQYIGSSAVFEHYNSLKDGRHRKCRGGSLDGTEDAMKENDGTKMGPREGRLTIENHCLYRLTAVHMESGAAP